MKTLGILGGMGPLATIDLYQKIVSLTPAKCDQEHIHVVIDSYAQIPDRTKYILGGGENPLPMMCEAANRLKQAGCDAVIMPCNTAHYFANDIQREVGVEILYMNKITVNALINRYKDAKNIAVIATTGTKIGRVYDDILNMHGLNSVEFSDCQQNAFMKCIYDGVKAGKTHEYIELFNKTLAKIKADVYIAACTEIPIFLPYIDGQYRFVDATLELAKYAVEFALKD
ncbi:aspartate/glutamate racemase family protein [Campylobacter majalis]|uniref:aspartate/glutamate racemase family protein n=1 Tax=Campylobacter majalis TaxID=2790656 RepID=UPI003D691410